MKKIVCIMAAIFISLIGCTKIFAADGTLWGVRTKDLKVLKTEWFDIIFPPESEESAVQLYQNADRIYSEIAELYGRAPICRMPVVLTPQVQTHNAYFSLAPYNLIVLYDTIPSENMLVHSDSLLGTFRHELTHAYTYNLKSPALYKASSFFGDVLLFSLLSISSGWAEGATLTSESAGGEGRLNDEYSLHMVRQAKIENQFPKYADVQGASDVYPRGSFYNFNAGFAQWLQKTYGMQKYAEFWYSCINGKHIFASTNFKKVYGLKLNEAWSQFAEDFYVPDVEPNPVAAGLCYDFFDFIKNDANGKETNFIESKKNDYSACNEGGSLYSNVCVSERGLYFVDKACNAVYFVENKNGKRKIKKLFTQTGVNQINVSQDGRFIAIQYTAQNEGTYKECIKIYDCLKRNFYKIDGTAKTNPAIICKNDDSQYFIVYTKFNAQKTSICIEKILLDGRTDTINGFEEIKTIPQNSNVYNFSFTDIGEGDFAFIKCDSLNFLICGANLNGETIFEYELPSEKMRLRGLSYSKNDDGGKLLFSFTNKGTLPRLGMLNLSSKEFFLQQNDVSGGVFCPVIYEDNIIYSGNFYRQNRLFVAASIGKNFSEPVTAATVSAPTAISAATASATALNTHVDTVDQTGTDTPTLQTNVNSQNDVRTNLPAKIYDYKPFSYLTRGIFVPVSIATSKSCYKDFSSSTNYFPFGITFITAEPWTNGNNVILSAGYGIGTNSFASNIQYTGGTDTSHFKYSFSAGTEFDFSGWKQAEAGASGSFLIPFGSMLKITLFESVYGFIEKNDFNHYAYNDCGFLLSNVHYSGPGKYERAGFSVVQAFTYALYNNLSGNQLLQNGNLAFELNAYIPKLLPVTCTSGFVYNFPVKLSASLFPYDTISKKVSGGTKKENVAFENSVLNFDVQTVIFSMDIQKAVPLVPAIFTNEFLFILRYNAAFTEEKPFTWGFLSANEHLEGIFSGKSTYKSMVELKLQLGLTPNLGETARNQFRTDFSVSMYYSFVTNKFMFDWAIASHF